MGNNEYVFILNTYNPELPTKNKEKGANPLLTVCIL
jgi:hypothetical protein